MSKLKLFVDSKLWTEGDKEGLVNWENHDANMEKKHTLFRLVKKRSLRTVTFKNSVLKW